MAALAARHSIKRGNNMENETVEISSEEQVAPATEVIDSKQETQTTDHRQEYNWRAVREREKEREQEIKRLRELNDRLLQSSLQQVQTPVEEDELDKIDDDEFIPKGKQKKLVQRETKQLKEKIDHLEKSLEQQRQIQMFSSLQAQYPDFSQVVTQDTLAQLEIQEPELAKAIEESKDPYKVLLQSYKFIKALNINKKDVNKRAKEIDKKLEENEKTVPSPMSYDKRPMAQAFKIGESKEEQMRLYQEMMGYASKVGFGY